jgi:hypothetical protein
MHPHDDLSDLERRLSAWQPARDGLDADAMLFAAGRASAPRRLAWPALAACLAALALSLGTWAAVERAGRLALAERLRQQAPVEPAPPTGPVETPSAEVPGPTSLLAAHRALEHGLDAWAPRPIDTPAPGGSPEPPVLQVGDRKALLEQ